jgi:hypothetical protein
MQWLGKISVVELVVRKQKQSCSWSISESVVRDVNCMYWILEVLGCLLFMSHWARNYFLSIHWEQIERFSIPTSLYLSYEWCGIETILIEWKSKIMYIIGWNKVCPRNIIYTFISSMKCNSFIILFALKSSKSHGWTFMEYHLCILMDELMTLYWWIWTKFHGWKVIFME